MLNKSGNLLDENIEITKELLDFALVNNYKISLKTGDYSKSLISHTGRYNRELIRVIHLLYLIGEFYPNRYYQMLMFKTADHIIAIFCSQKLPKLSPEEFMRMYKQDVKQSRHQTCLKNLGYTHPNYSPKSQLIRKQRYKEKRGVDNPQQDPEVQAKIKRTKEARKENYLSDLKAAFTTFDKIGATHHMKDEKLKSITLDKLRESGGIGFQRPGARDYALQMIFEKIGTDKPSTVKSIREKIREAMNSDDVRQRVQDTKSSKDERYAKILKIYEDYENGELDEIQAFKFIDENFTGSSRLVHLTNLGLRKQYQSSYEIKILNFLKSLNVECIHNYYSDKLRNTNGNKFEVDIFIPSYNVGIEVNGVYNHSKDGRNPEFQDNFHYYKMVECRKNNIILLSFTCYEIDNYFDFVKSVIMYHIDKGSRSDVIRNINESMLEDLQFKSMDDIENSLNYSINENLDAFNVRLNERIINGYTYIDCGISIKESN